MSGHFESNAVSDVISFSPRLSGHFPCYLFYRQRSIIKKRSASDGGKVSSVIHRLFLFGWCLAIPTANTPGEVSERLKSVLDPRLVRRQPRHLPIVRTTRKRTLPLCICSYASATRLNGYFSIIGCTPVSALNSKASCESRAVPEYQPDTDRR